MYSCRWISWTFSIGSLQAGWHNQSKETTRNRHHQFQASADIRQPIALCMYIHVSKEKAGSGAAYQERGQFGGQKQWVSHSFYLEASNVLYYVFIHSHGIEAFSLLPVVNILWVLSLCIYSVGCYTPSLLARRSAPCSYPVMRQKYNCGNNDLSCHLVGTLMSHWRPLMLHWTTYSDWEILCDNCSTAKLSPGLT